MVKFHGHIYDSTNGVVTYPNENGSSVVFYCDFVLIGHSFDGAKIYGLFDECLYGLSYGEHTSKHNVLDNYLGKHYVRRKIGNSFYFVPVPYVIF